MAHCHTAHLPLGALLSPCTMCGTGIGKTLLSYWNSVSLAALLGRGLVTSAYDAADVAYDGDDQGGRTSSVLTQYVRNYSSAELRAAVPTIATRMFGEVSAEFLSRCVECADGVCFWRCLWPFPTEVCPPRLPPSASSSLRNWSNAVRSHKRCASLAGQFRLPRADMHLPAHLAAEPPWLPRVPLAVRATAPQLAVVSAARIYGGWKSR